MIGKENYYQYNSYDKVVVVSGLFDCVHSRHEGVR